MPVLAAILWATSPVDAQNREQQLIDSLDARLRIEQHDSVRILLMEKLLDIYTYYKTEEGFKYEKQALEMAGSTSWREGTAKLKLGVGRLYWRKGNFETALRYHREALALYETIGDKQAIALTTIYMGQDYVDNGKYTEALQYFDRARQMYEDMDNLHGVGMTYQFLAFVYGSQGNHAEAARQNFKALAVFEKMGDQLKIAGTKGNIADAYEQIGNYAEALKYYRQANEASKIVREYINSSIGYNAVGAIYCKLKNYPEALANHDTALQIARTIHDDYCIAKAYEHIGKVFKAQGLLDKALPNYLLAVAHYQKIGNKLDLVSALAQVGICRVRNKQYKEARFVFERAEGLSKNLDSKIPLADLYEGMAALDSATGNWQDAYTHFRQYIAFRDSLNSQESMRKIVHAQVQYDFEKRALFAKIEQENREARQLAILISSLGAALFFFGFIFFRLKVRRDRANAEAARLKELNEAKSQFLNTVSHELRTPLTSIMGFSKLIKKRLEERIFPNTDLSVPKTKRSAEQVMDNLDIVVSESERLTTLINNVLDLAKIESGQVVWNEEEVNLHDLITRAIAATEAIFQQKKLKLRLQVPHGLPTTIGDADRLLQVLVNLLSNAVKFTDHGAVTVSVERQSDTMLLVGVADTGRGIPEEDREAVFEKFKQVTSDTLTDKPQGTGLGLPICREIVEHHGGRIWVESEIGKGSIFWFTLPF